MDQADERTWGVLEKVELASPRVVPPARIWGVLRLVASQVHCGAVVVCTTPNGDLLPRLVVSRLHCGTTASSDSAATTAGARALREPAPLRLYG